VHFHHSKEKENKINIKIKENKKKLLVSKVSHNINETEKNYETHNKEMLAVIRGLEN